MVKATTIELPNISTEDTFATIIDMNEELQERYLREIIIKTYGENTRVGIPISKEEILHKLNDPQSDQEPSIIQKVLLSESSDITVDYALAIADLVYYFLQENYHITSRNDTYIRMKFRDWRKPYLFCIVKYLTRIRNGMVDEENEKETMDAFLKYLASHPLPDNEG